jgi:hypothetical protein
MQMTRMIALETCFAAVRTAMPALSLERLIELFSTAPRHLFDLPKLKIASNEPASLSLFYPTRSGRPRGFIPNLKTALLPVKRSPANPLALLVKTKYF